MAPAPFGFYDAPLKYLRWASRERPALFWSVALGCMGPIMMVVVPPIRHRLGDGPRQVVPHSYPSKSIFQLHPSFPISLGYSSLFFFVEKRFKITDGIFL